MIMAHVSQVTPNQGGQSEASSKTINFLWSKMYTSKWFAICGMEIHSNILGQAQVICVCVLEDVYQQVVCHM